ncbi:MAG: 16S rRNA (adenine(1518)-N(6)/adenine(1519)-N(6))-dimethyltransferase RsmA [Clostridia bacterium]|nr:16S rRNA (adenine(1518)-N(6)/adenine(1519)-N(6))-dimethyltransferase RsmA [Clostridia bacterium]
MSEALKETKFLMKKYKIKANKNLGQNFLIDDNALQDIANGAEISKNDLVIEIGPGLGSLTKLLLEKAKKVICIELDKKMVKILKDRFIAYNNLEIINEDVLRIDLNDLIKAEKENDTSIKNVKVVANLPYYITTPIIMKLVENDLDINGITVMIQKEVAERLIAIPGTKETGAITYTMYYYCEGKKIRKVENTCFIPEPEVTSEVITLNLREIPAVQVKDKKVMFNIIKSAYMQRRKTLINSLTSVGVFKNKEEGIQMLKKLGLKEDIRPENMKIEDFAKLTDLFLKNISENR